MSRQMNSDIFSNDPVENFNSPTRSGSFDAHSPFQAIEPNPLYDDVLSRLEKTRFEAQEWMKSLNLRLEKTNQRIQGVEDRIQHSARETYERLNFVAGRIKDRTNSDMKVEGLIERHNQIVQSFELRLGQAQKLIENQALQLAKQQLLIDDARRQIEKLKKL